MTNVSSFFSEFLATSVLLILVLSLGDKQNHPVPHGLLPVAIFLLILGIGCALGMETGMIHIIIRELRMDINPTIGYALNPARDLGPRLLTSMVGYGKAVYTFRKSVMRPISV